MERTSIARALGREPAWHASEKQPARYETTLSADYVARCIECGLRVTLGDGKSIATQASLESYIRNVPNNEGFGYINGVGEFLMVTRP